METDIESNAEDLNELGEKVSDTEESISVIDNEIVTLRETDENLFGQILDIDLSVKHLEVRFEIIREDIHSLQRTDIVMQASIDETQGQLDALSSSVDQRFNDFNENYSEDILHLNSTLELQESQINNLEIQDLEHSEAIIGINSEIDAVKTRLSIIEGQNQDSFQFLVSGSSSANSDHPSQMGSDIRKFENFL